MKSITRAREVLAGLPRCTAIARQTGAQCKNPGVGGGGKCRFHGGASTGRPLIHGQTTKRAKIERDWIRLLVGMVHAVHGGKSAGFLKPGHLTVVRVTELLKAKALSSAHTHIRGLTDSHN